MSALADAGAPDARERSEWRGEDVSAGEVAERLMALNREHARHEHGHAATRTLNLLVAPGEDVGADALAAQLAGLADRHPSRTLVVREGAAARLDALVAIDCTIGSARAGAGSSGHCHDMALLTAGREQLAHADSLVRPLRVAGLPTVLWLPGTRPSRAQEPLAALADAIVLDSGAASGAALPAAFARAAAFDVQRVRDVAWLRLARWRRHVAARFDDPGAQALLARVDRVELRSCAPQQASALLLAGWIAARAGWSIERLAPEPAGWAGVARRDDDGEVAIGIGPPERPDLTGIHALALHAGARRSRCAHRSPRRTRRARSPPRSGCSMRRRRATRPRSPPCWKGWRKAHDRGHGRWTTPKPPRARAPSGSSEIVDAARAERGVAHVALAGGRTPARTYELLADLVGDWRNVHLWFGDERCVPLDDPDSNDTLLCETRCSRGCPPARRRPSCTRSRAPARATRPLPPQRTSATCATAIPGEPPRLDLALLGLGEDGHTASLFPDDEAVLQERERLCVPVHGRKPPFERVTFTLPLLRAARRTVVLTAGAGKQWAVGAMLAGPSAHVPASLLADGDAVELIVDRAAAPA